MFYVYVHCRPDGTPFYVGKGSKDRCSLKYARNKWHSCIVKHYGAENIITEIQECSSEEEAFLRERLIISSQLQKGVKLVNQTEGGEGFTGGRHAQQSRDRIGAHWRGAKWMTDGKCEQRVLPNDINTKLVEGWKFGHLHGGGGCQEYKWVNNGKLEKLVNSELVDLLISKNWVFGRLARKGRIRVCKGDTHKYVHEGTLQNALNDGWTKGGKVKGNRTNLGKSFINKDGRIQMCGKEEISIFLADGWRLGKKK